MLWFWLWFVLVLGALVVLGLLAWRIFRKGVAVFRAVGRVADTVGETNAASESAFDEWLLLRAEQDLADADQRERDLASGHGRRPSGTGSRRSRSPRVVR